MFIAMKTSAAFTVSTSSVKFLTQLGLTSAQLEKLAGMDISVQGANIIVHYDGTEIGSDGMLLLSGGIFRVTTRTEALCIVAKRSGGSDATVVVTALIGT